MYGKIKQIRFLIRQYVYLIMPGGHVDTAAMNPGHVILPDATNTSC